MLAVLLLEKGLRKNAPWAELNDYLSEIYQNHYLTHQQIELTHFLPILRSYKPAHAEIWLQHVQSINHQLNDLLNQNNLSATTLLNVLKNIKDLIRAEERIYFECIEEHLPDLDHEQFVKDCSNLQDVCVQPAVKFYE